MKILAETNGSFQLLHSEQRELVRAEGITVIEKSRWAAERTILGQLLTRGEVNDEASDAEWCETVRESDGDLDLALASFLDRFPLTPESASKAEPPPRVPTATHPPGSPQPARGDGQSIAPSAASTAQRGHKKASSAA